MEWLADASPCAESSRSEGFSEVDADSDTVEAGFRIDAEVGADSWGVLGPRLGFGPADMTDIEGPTMGK